MTKLYLTAGEKSIPNFESLKFFDSYAKEYVLIILCNAFIIKARIRRYVA